jgi:phosphoglycerate kinase
MIKSIAELPIEGRRVFIRVDFNVPLTPAKGVADDSRIVASVPTIEHAIKRGARVILASHLGRPKGPTPGLSLEPVGARLAELLGKEVLLTDEAVGDGARKVVADLRDGEVALLENLRFFGGEEANDDGFARQLAAYADVYINDAFGTAHRAHASTAGMIKYVAEKGAGFLMLKEVQFLGKLLGDVERPYLAVVGGAKVSDKIGVLENLLGRVDAFLIGGAMANTFIKARGGDVGKSKVEEDKLALARAFLKKAEDKNVEVLLPSDVVAAASLDAPSGTAVRASEVPPDMMALDIGPQAASGFADRIARARTVFFLEWANGRVREAAVRRGNARRGQSRRCLQRTDRRRWRRLRGGGERDAGERSDQAHLDGRRGVAGVHRRQDAAGDCSPGDGVMRRGPMR